MDKLRSRTIYIAFGLAIVLYVAQVFTPLRLTSDGITYLSLADSAAKTGFFNALRQPNFPFPKGYPVFIFVFMKARLFSSMALVISNLLLFAAGLIFSFCTLTALGFGHTHSRIACLLTLLSFSAVKFVTQGMSDFLFFALSGCACWLMTLQSRYKWVAILPCIACAIEVRFIGLALLAPIVAIIWPFVRKRPAIFAAAIVVTACCAGAGVWAGHHYLASNFQMFNNNGLFRFAGKNLVAHLQDFGELASNAPLSKLPVWSHPAVFVIGSIAMLLFFSGIVALLGRSQWLPCYLIAYSALIFPWPYTDPRFWLPAMPFLFITMHAGAKAITDNVPIRALATYGVVFCAIGFGALAYSSRLTFSGSQFAYRYGDGRLTTTYVARCSAATSTVNQPALHLLQRYEWRCQGVE